MSNGGLPLPHHAAVAEEGDAVRCGGGRNILLGNAFAHRHIAAADVVFSRNGIGLHLGSIIGGVEGNAAALGSCDAANGCAVIEYHAGIAAGIQLCNAAIVDFHIAAVPGDVQGILISRTGFIDSRHAGQCSFSGNTAAVFYIQIEILGLPHAAALIGTDVAVQIQHTGNLQRAAVGNPQGFIPEGIHQHLSALLNVQAGLGGDVQLGGGENHRFLNQNALLLHPLREDLLFFLAVGFQNALFLVRKAIVGFRLGAVRGGGNGGGDPHIQRAALGNHQRNPLGDGVFLIQNAGNTAVD